MLDRRMDWILRLLGLWEDPHSLISSYSKGMRQKILLASALLHDPKLLILDEPFSGLDVNTCGRSGAVQVPPLWLLGLEQQILGNPDPCTARLGWWAIVDLAGRAATAILAYWWSYRHDRVRVLQTPGQKARGRHGWVTEPGLRPRSLGVFTFIGKTLGRSPQHRLIWIVFLGVAVAINANGLENSVMTGSRVPLLTVLAAAHLVLSLFTLAGLHYLFRFPGDPRRIGSSGSTSPVTPSACYAASNGS